VLLDEDKVRVRVYNVETRSNSIATIFGRVLGWQSMDVSTVAAAEAVSAGSGVCPLPIAIPDRWLDNTGGANPQDGRFNLADGDKYEPYYDPPENPPMKPMEGQCPSPPGYDGCPVPGGVSSNTYTGSAYTGFYGDDPAANLGV